VRTNGPGRKALGRAPVTNGSARWSFRTSSWRPGAWRLRAECGSAQVDKTLKVVVPPGPPPASDTFTTPTVTVTPAPTPAYRPGIHDYVVECLPGDPVDVQVDTAAGTWASVDGSRWATGAVVAAVPLKPGQGFDIKVSGGGSTKSATVRCLPTDFPTLVATGQGPPGWYGFGYPYLSGSPFLILVDRYGTPVWWFRDVETGDPADFRVWTRKELSAFGWSGKVAVSWATGGTYVLRRLDGTVLHRWGTGMDLDRHELVPTPRGTVYVIRYLKRACDAKPAECVDMTAYGGGPADTVIDAEILELDKASRVVWSWQTRGHIAVSESQRLLDHPAEPIRQADGDWDLVHLNSVEPDGKGVIFSSRHLDAVYRVSRKTGNITWKLGGTTTGDSLVVTGDPAAGIPLGMQHDARRLPDGTLSVYDNAHTLPRSPRMVRFTFDGSAGTATVVQTLQDLAVSNSAFAGSARPLPGGSWLMAWGANDRISVNAADGSELLTIRSTLPNADKAVPYRAVPLSTQQASAGEIRAAMSKMHRRK
ncbi:MAG: arylsulfotransferase family protein, partial [Gemmatimonadota bacterium]|nr:arylsulfotransferase family protein [Gemmatimonadota bacterium]